MAGAAGILAVESGQDLSNRLMIAFGGNSPLHARRMARRAGMRRIMIHHDPGVGSAVGFLFAPVSFEIIRSCCTTLQDADRKALNALFDAMYREAEAVLRAGAPTGPLTQRRVAFMRYNGQGHETEGLSGAEALQAADTDRLRADFKAEYSQQFVRRVPRLPMSPSLRRPHLSAPVLAPKRTTAVISG